MNSARIRRLAALAATAAVALAAPSAASALSLNNVAIASKHTGFTGVLDVAGGSTVAGAKVIQYSVTGGSNQRWNFVEYGNEWSPHTQIVNQKSGLCLTTSGIAGQQLYVTYCNTSNPRQDWHTTLPPFGLNPMYGFAAAYVFGYNYLVIDVQGASGLAGTPVIGWPATNADNQRFAYWYWS
jgi:hypothetical protein